MGHGAAVVVGASFGGGDRQVPGRPLYLLAS